MEMKMIRKTPTEKKSKYRHPVGYKKFSQLITKKEEDSDCRGR